MDSLGTVLLLYGTRIMEWVLVIGKTLFYTVSISYLLRACNKLRIIRITQTYYNENDKISTFFLPNKGIKAKEEELFLVKFIGKMAPKPSSINSFLQALSIK